ncbi:hypothetical protein NLM24_32545 [Nocardia zapadnayensis]|nr:hypothetical protein [Nocardia zapadnayensis]MCX0275322.1 hypothetical protein [Nocardia zapadnayensis]
MTRAGNQLRRRPVDSAMAVVTGVGRRAGIGYAIARRPADRAQRST